MAGRLLIDAWQPVTLPVDLGGTPVAETWETVAGEGYTGVIAPLDRASILRFGYGTRASGWWLPTAEEIAVLEANFPDYLAGVVDARTRALAPEVGTYLWQYAGLVVEGRALIFVNALCEDPTGGRWTSEPVFVDDGGDCFVQVYWEPATNGEA